MQNKAEQSHSKSSSSHGSSATTLADIAYDSNPFTSSWTGIQKLLRTNTQTAVGVAFFNVLLFVLLGLTAVAMLLATIAFFIQNYSSYYSLAFPDSTGLGFLNSVNNTGIYATWSIGLLIIILVMTLLQVLQLRLTAESARGRSLKFGALLGGSMRYILPIIGFVALIMLVIIASVVAIALLANIAGYITFILAIAWIIAAVYVGLRLSFTTYCIVDQQLGPIDAMKRSWSITEGHIIETIGTAAIASVIIYVPGIVLTALGLATQSASVLSGMINLLAAVVVMVLTIAASMAVAERYIQLEAVAEKRATATALSPFNYLAIVLAIVLSAVMSALSPKVDNTSLPVNGWYNQDTPAPSDYNQDSSTFFY